MIDTRIVLTDYPETGVASNLELWLSRSAARYLSDALLMMSIAIVVASSERL
jgi:hypothetical protein